VQGWIFDAYADHEKDSLVLWLWSRGKAHRIEDTTYRPSFFVHAPLEELREFRERLAVLDGVQETRLARRRISLERREKVPVLEIVPRRYSDLQDVARSIDSNGKYHDFQLFNVDLRLSQRYFLQHRIFPMGLVDHLDGQWRAAEEPFALDYELPPLKAVALELDVDAPAGIPRLQDSLRGARVGEAAVGGTEGEIMEKITAEIRQQDPDVLLTDGGDAFVIPYLAGKAEARGMTLQLGRDPDPVRPKKGKSYFTYGKIVYKPAQYLFRGRIHLDRGHFAYREADLAGLAELSRLSCLVPQEQSRLTPGTAITAMQVNQATRDGVLVLWKKNRPEEFKTAEDLLLGDRGGFTFEPAVGLHENILEVDFASLYPNIMAKYNISPETLDCACCKEDGLRVPELAYHTCVREKGLIGRVLQPVIERKRYFKKMKKTPGPRRGLFEARDTILKWLLVTCFGYTGYKNARFGRIECHEAINAYARETMLRSMEIAESHGYEVLHGIVDSLWLRSTARSDPPQRVVEHISTAIGIPLDVEGTYKWVVFLPAKTTGVGALNRYYGLFQDGEMKLRGIELRKHDTCGLVIHVQTAMLEELAKAGDARAFLERIPRALDVLRAAAVALREGLVPVHDLVLTKSVTREVEEYSVFTNVVAALKQLKMRGFDVHPGEYVRFVILKQSSRDPEAKVRVAEFLQGDERPDVEEYLKLLARSAETLFAPFGYTEEKVLADLRTVHVDAALPVAGESLARIGVGYHVDSSPELPEAPGA